MRTNKRFNQVIAGGIVALTLSAIAWATPPSGFTATNIAGPIAFDAFKSKAQTGM